MVITWYGHSCFKIQSGELVLVIDPFSKEVGLTPPRFRADMVLVSHNHYDHSNVEAIRSIPIQDNSGKMNEPMLINGPGEYEIKGVYIQGLETFHDESQGLERGPNTVYKMTIEGINILHLGDFGEKELRQETLDLIGDIDILMVPIGGKYTIDADGAVRVIKQIEPRLVIPMHYKIPGLKFDIDGADKFLKEMGAAQREILEKLTIKKKDLGEEEKTEVVVLRLA